MKRIHIFIFTVLALIVAMALGTVIFAACKAPLPDEIEGIDFGYVSDEGQSVATQDDGAAE